MACCLRCLVREARRRGIVQRRRCRPRSDLTSKLEALCRRVSNLDIGGSRRRIAPRLRTRRHRWALCTWSTPRPRSCRRSWVRRRLPNRQEHPPRRRRRRSEPRVRPGSSAGWSWLKESRAHDEHAGYPRTVSHEIQVGWCVTFSGSHLSQIGTDRDYSPKAIPSGYTPTIHRFLTASVSGSTSRTAPGSLWFPSHTT